MSSHEQIREDLPLYALGALPAEEVVEFERHLEQCAGCRAELRALSEAAGQIGMAAGVTQPPASVRQRLLQDLQPAAAAAVSARLRSKPAWNGWQWAPAMAAVALAAFALVGWWHGRQLERELNVLRSTVDQNGDTVRRSRQLLGTLMAADAMHVTLTAAGRTPQPQAKAIYSPARGMLVLTASNLPAVPEHKAYELWMIPANGGAPIASGMFKPDARGSAVMVMQPHSSDVKLKAFAVTIEAEAGASTPTMPIVLSGAV